ncbi:MAG: sensor histidine kinase, partial [Pseudoclavibacter sp.]
MPSIRASLADWWTRPAAAGAIGPRARDLVLAGVAAGLAVAEGFLRTDLSWPAATVAVTVAAMVGMVWRRTRPLAVATWFTALTTGFGIAQAVFGVGQNALASMFVLVAIPYAVYRWGSGRAQVLGAGVLAVGLCATFALGTAGLDGAISGVAVFASVGLVGALRRQRVEARSRELDAVRLREREALARDLHDTVAHRVSAIAIRAQVARAATADGPSALAESLDVIEHEAKAALDETRALVGAVRRD